MICFRLVHVQSIIVIVLAWFTASCATPGTSGVQFRDPIGEGTVLNAAVIKLPFSDAWDSLIGQLAKSFFESDAVSVMVVQDFDGVAVKELP